MTSKLINAVILGNENEVDLILKSISQNQSEHVALLEAIERNHKHIVHLLLNNTKIKETKLQEALYKTVVKSNWNDVVENLLEKGAQAGKWDKSGNTAVHIAFDDGVTEDIIDLLIQCYLTKDTTNITNANGVSLLHIACTRSNLHAVKMLLKADPTSIDKSNKETLYTPLHYAVKRGRHEIAKYLIEFGADIYKRDVNKSTPLHWALWQRDVQMIDLIISMDQLRENVANKYGLTHFMAACASSNTDTAIEYLEALLDHFRVPNQDLIGSKVSNFGDFTGYTPLHFAVDFGNEGTVKFLLQRGADCCAVAHKGSTSHLIAKVKKHERVQEILQQHCELVKKCREMRKQSPDFGQWGERYENFTVLENVQTFKHLREVYNNLKAVEPMDYSSNKFDSNCESEFISTDFQGFGDTYFLL